MKTGRGRPSCLCTKGGPVAQRLEQGTHNPLVGGSNPSGPTTSQTSPFQTLYQYSAGFVTEQDRDLRFDPEA